MPRASSTRTSIGCGPAMSSTDREKAPREAAREIEPAVPAQKLIRVTDAVIARSPAFRFAKPFSGLEVVPRRGDVIAWDGDNAVRAPYDNCVLVMPVPNNVKTGLTAVRLGRVEAR